MVVMVEEAVPEAQLLCHDGDYSCPGKVASFIDSPERIEVEEAVAEAPVRDAIDAFQSLSSPSVARSEINLVTKEESISESASEAVTSIIKQQNIITKNIFEMVSQSLPIPEDDRREKYDAKSLLELSNNGSEPLFDNETLCQPGAGNLFECTDCGILFDGRNNAIQYTRLRDRRDEKQNNIQPFQCRDCVQQSIQDRTAYRLSLLRTGLSSDASKSCVNNSVPCRRTKKCQIGDKKIAHHSHFTSHLRVHTSEKLVQCVDHAKESGVQIDKTLNSPEMFQCQYCPKLFLKKSKLIIHAMFHTGETTFSCTFCKAKFIEKSDLRSHICEAKLAEQSDLNDIVSGNETKSGALGNSNKRASSATITIIEDEQTFDNDEMQRRQYPKRHRSSINPTPKVSTKKKLPNWCVLCERPIGELYDQQLDEPGGVACQSSRCQRSFHIACLHDNGVHVLDLDAYLCAPCSNNQVLCQECQQPIDDSDFAFCPSKNCRRRYHRMCWKWGDHSCPFHECRKCAKLNVEGESRSFLDSTDRYSCLRCATCYHVSCIPKAAVRIQLGHGHQNRFVCERHEPFPKSIRWRPLLIVPLWVGDGTLSELSFSLPPDWLNSNPDTEEDVIIHPQILSSLGGQLSKKSNKKSISQLASEKPSGRCAISYQLAEKARQLVVSQEIHPKTNRILNKTIPKQKVDTTQNIEVVRTESQASDLANLDVEYVPEFTLEPPPGFVLEPYQRRLRNLYVAPRPTSREDAHICYCRPGTNCADESCVNRSLQIECDARFCPCADQCRNQRLQKREWQPMRLVFTKDRGCGMMSQVPIKSGDLVIEYVGEVLNELTFRQRIQENTEKKRPQDNYYMMQLSRHLVIDARKTGNNARFLNHSCSPNCCTEIWEVAKGELRAGIFAMYDIPPGVELTYDYNFELFSKAVNSESVPCRCGSRNCSKFLGVKPLRLNSKKQAMKLSTVTEK